ncbi:hypothetical protein DE146DRAFT_163002 [Phaeosphaeria sp. MPI-PUGE-AT-0046c]|nr:hypothetical protein DE146DRAFT_163002 [Phaeosphaeria sp. MPI-PUGE-AT-0046c]
MQQICTFPGRFAEAFRHSTYPAMRLICVPIDACRYCRRHAPRDHSLTATARFTWFFGIDMTRFVLFVHGIVTIRILAWTQERRNKPSQQRHWLDLGSSSDIALSFLRGNIPRAGRRHSPFLVDRCYRGVGIWTVESGVRVSSGSGRYIRLGYMQAIAKSCTTPSSTFMRGLQSVLIHSWVPDLCLPYSVRTAAAGYTVRTCISFWF